MFDLQRAHENLAKAEIALRRAIASLDDRLTADNADYVKDQSTRAAAACLRVVEMLRGLKGDKDYGR